MLLNIDKEVVIMFSFRAGCAGTVPLDNIRGSQLSTFRFTHISLQLARLLACLLCVPYCLQ